jgi:hypothetical protein
MDDEFKTLHSAKEGINAWSYNIIVLLEEILAKLDILADANN